MTDEAKALMEKLRALHVWPQAVADGYADLLTPRQIEKLYEVGRVSHEAADLIETQAREIERLRAKLRSIEKGVENGQALFAERQGNRAKPIWYAVNILQDYLAACKGTASAALAGDSHDQ